VLQIQIFGLVWTGTTHLDFTAQFWTRLWLLIAAPCTFLYIESRVQQLVFSFAGGNGFSQTTIHKEIGFGPRLNKDACLGNYSSSHHNISLVG